MFTLSRRSWRSFQSGQNRLRNPASRGRENLPGPSRHRQTEQGETRLPAPGLSRKAKTKKGHVQPGSSRRSPAVSLGPRLILDSGCRQLRSFDFLVRDAVVGHPPACRHSPVVTRYLADPTVCSRRRHWPPPCYQLPTPTTPKTLITDVQSPAKRGGSECYNLDLPTLLLSHISPSAPEIRPAFTRSSLTTSLSTQSCLCLHI